MSLATLRRPATPVPGRLQKTLQAAAGGTGCGRRSTARRAPRLRRRRSARLHVRQAKRVQSTAHSAQSLKGARARAPGGLTRAARPAAGGGGHAGRGHGRPRGRARRRPLLRGRPVACAAPPARRGAARRGAAGRAGTRGASARRLHRAARAGWGGADAAARRRRTCGRSGTRRGSTGTRGRVRGACPARYRRSTTWSRAPSRTATARASARRSRSRSGSTMSSSAAGPRSSALPTLAPTRDPTVHSLPLSPLPLLSRPAPPALSCGCAGACAAPTRVRRGVWQTKSKAKALGTYVSESDLQGQTDEVLARPYPCP